MLYIWKVTIGHFRHEYFVKQNQILRDALPQIKTYNNFTYDIKHIAIALTFICGT